MIKGFNKKEDKERQIRPILARQVWIDESAVQVVPCGRDLTLAVAFVENKLTRRERKDFQSHLLDCRHCRQFVSSEVRLQRPVFESPVAVTVSRGAFFSHLRFQWVAAAAALVLTAGVTSFLFVNQNAGTGRASIPQNGTVSTPAVAGTINSGTPTVSSVSKPEREIVPAVPLNGNTVADSLRTSIDLGGIAGAGVASTSAASSVTNLSVVTPVPNSVAKRDLQENAFNVDGSTVNPVAPTVAGVIPPLTPVTEEKRSPSSEYRVRVESTNLDAKSVAAPAPTTELKTELISMSLTDLDQAAINVPASANSFVRHDSEIVIMSRPLVPWTTSVKPNSSVAENSISKRSPYSNQTRVAFAGKLFNQVDKVWIDQEFTASPNLPVVKVKVKSPEGQELLAANPGLKPFFTMHRQIVVVFEGKVYMTY